VWCVCEGGRALLFFVHGDGVNRKNTLVFSGNYSE